MKNILKILLILHLISVIGVIYTLTYNSWLTNYIMLNKFLNLEQIISENDILNQKCFEIIWLKKSGLKLNFKL